MLILHTGAWLGTNEVGIGSEWKNQGLMVHNRGFNISFYVGATNIISDKIQNTCVFSGLW